MRRWQEMTATWEASLGNARSSVIVVPQLTAGCSLLEMTQAEAMTFDDRRIPMRARPVLWPQQHIRPVDAILASKLAVACTLHFVVVVSLFGLYLITIRQRTSRVRTQILKKCQTSRMDSFRPPLSGFRTIQGGRYYYEVST
jgi:hypothetical protein